MYLIVKRAIDILLSTIALLLLLPLLIPIMIILRCTGEGEIFYYQRRIGFRNKEFNIIKFATMLKNSPNIGTGMITLRNDPRLLPLGKFLRKTKINELPQVFNVLRGDMSVVGPRPLVTRTFDAYPEDIRHKVYDARPGITGIGSIVFRDEEALVSAATVDPHVFYRETIAPYKGQLEMWYLANRSLRTDFLIIFVTGWVVLFPDSKIVHKAFKGLPAR